MILRGSRLLSVDCNRALAEKRYALSQSDFAAPENGREWRSQLQASSQVNASICRIIPYSLKTVNSKWPK
jgi:hypothetical protein